MQKLSIALVGFGNVGKAFVKLFEEKTDCFEKKFDKRIKVSGIVEGNPGPDTMAYGLLSDLISLLREEAL